MNRVFVDTAGYFALADVRDDNHSVAMQVLRQLISQRARLFTSNFVVAELHGLLLNRAGRDLAERILAEIDASTTTNVRVSRKDELRGRTIIHQYTDKEFSLVDATSFAIMERLYITQAFVYHAGIHVRSSLRPVWIYSCTVGSLALSPLTPIASPDTIVPARDEYRPGHGGVQRPSRCESSSATVTRITIGAAPS